MIQMYDGVVNSIETVTTGAISSSDTTINVLDETRIPDAPNILVLGSGASAETVKLTAKVGSVLTVVRGLQGTAKSWASGTLVARNFTEYDHRAFKENISELETKQGNLTTLTTTNKTNLVSATNELNSSLAQTATRIFNVEKYGADITGATDCSTAFNNAVNDAILANGGVVYLPSGIYMMGVYPSSLRQQTITATKDLKNIVIEGAGKSSIIKGVSATGHDVLQLNGVKNLSLRNFSIKSVKTTPADVTHGCNGISMTNGSNNITIDNVYVDGLPYVVKIDHIDGGKPFAVQTGALGKEPCANIKIRNCESENCPYGFEMSHMGTEIYSPYGIEVSGNTFKAFFRGIEVNNGVSGAGNYIAKLSVNIHDNLVIGSQRALSLGRASGRASNNTFYSDIVAVPTAVAFDTTVFPIWGVGCENMEIESNFIYFARCDHYMELGATANGASKFCAVRHNQFTGASNGAGIFAIDSSGSTASNCVFDNNTFRNITTVEYSPAFYLGGNKNTIITIGAGTRFDKLGVGTKGDIAGAELVVNGKIGFAYSSDEKTAYQTIFASGTAIAVKQTVSSGITTKVFGIVSNTDAELFTINNSGQILTNQVENTATTGTITKRIPIFDTARNVMGYIPIYN